MSAPSLHRLARADVRVAPWDWPLARRERAAIDAHFAAAQRRRPLWNGRVLLSRDVAVAGDVLTGAAFETGFADFLWWRDSGFPDPTLCNIFAMAAIRDGDGAFLLAVMGDHTANAGRVYFPAGTPGPEDVAGGRIDFDGSMARELAEETGLDAATFDAVPGWTAVVDGPRVALIKELRTARAGADLADAVVAHLAADAEPELAGVVAVASRRAITPAMPAFVRAFLETALAG